MLEPISRKDWNTAAAAHLLNRAGFGATLDEIGAAARRDPTEVVDELVNFDRTPDPFDQPDWTKPEDASLRPEAKYKLRQLSEEARKEKIREIRRIELGQLRELRAWWLHRMRYTKRPLQEKLTLMWHSHWASSAEKVRSSYSMWQQNETLRAHAAGNFARMVTALSQDPAMLLYLDNAQSRAAHPNENYARELMELFTLGIGNYTEDDIKASARSFTGWTLHPQRFQFADRKSMHDDGEKTFMGRTGPFTGHDIIRIVLEQPAAAPYIAGRLWHFFAGENAPADPVPALAKTLLASKWELKPVLRELFLSRAFHAPGIVRNQVKSPAQWLVGTARQLEAPLPDTDTCTAILMQLGQNLFLPPSVKGWDGGYAWITTNTLLTRYNAAGILVKGGKSLGTAAQKMMEMDDMPGKARDRFVKAVASSKSGIECAKVLPTAARTSKEAALAHLENVLFHANLTEKDNRELRESLAKMPAPSAWSDDDVRTLLHTMMSTPYYQLT